MESPADILKITNLSKSYPIHKELALPVLQGIDLTIKAGELTAVMGPSGCGKTTLMNLISADGCIPAQPYRINISGF